MKFKDCWKNIPIMNYDEISDRENSEDDILIQTDEEEED